MTASLKGHTDIVRMLIEAKADVSTHKKVIEIIIIHSM